jgi:hypothetical protein
MTSMPRPMWAATLAKLVAPMEPERAAKAIAGMMPVLSFPDDAFTLASAREVASAGRVMEAEVRGPGGSLIRSAAYGPLTRVPTFGEIETAVGRWWRHEREMRKVRAAPIAREALPAPSDHMASSDASAETEAPDDAREHVANLVRAFVAERSFIQPANGPTRVPVKPRHLSDGRLLEEYQRLAEAGAPGAAIRLQTLRRKMAVDDADDAQARFRAALEPVEA